MLYPFFSIIIPTHNSDRFVPKAIDSLISQKFSDFEILIVDGLSDDNTVEVVNAFHDTRIQITSEKDTGIYDAMNKGVLLSKGQWLLFLGSDDRLHDPSVLQDVYDTVHAHPSSKFIYGDVMTSNGGTQTYRNYTYLRLLD